MWFHMFTRRTSVVLLFLGSLCYLACDTGPEGDSCDGVDCSGHGTCNAGVCTCATGYDGSSCDVCAAGFVGYPQCYADACSANNCNGNGTCAAGVCICDVGFAGANCDLCATGFA